MASIDDIRAERLKKLEALKKKGVNPYPAKSERTHTIAEVLEQFENLKEATIAGRLMNIRSFGGSVFADLNDGSAKMQIFLKGDEMDKGQFSLFEEVIDIGDFIEVSGSPYTTQKSERSILAKDWRILTKSLRPLPEKFHGLQDPEARFRQRHFDLLLNSELKEVFRLKARFWDVTREFLKKEGFLEVETPTLEITTGGAEARPFRTHHNDFDVDIYLRISIGELWQKRLMAAGFEKTFEIGRAYRNEGSSPEHLQEFTNMEFYAAYMNLEEGQDLVKKLYTTIAKEVFGKTKFETRGHKFDLAGDWEELDYVSTVEKLTGVNVLESSEDELRAKLNELGVKYNGENRERLTDSLWKYCRGKISGPAFLINHPKLVAPLSKENSKDERLTEMFQVILAGSEIGRAHAELNDPIEQKKRFDEQQKLIESGDEEAMMPDHEFVEVMEDGMPPNFGFGFGERLFAFMVDKPIRETQLFPLMKPKEEKGKSKELLSAVAVINTGAKMEKWQELNTIAHLTAALGVREGEKLMTKDVMQTEDKESIFFNIKHGIVTKTAGSNKELLDLRKKALEKKLRISDFTRDMIETTNDKRLEEWANSKNIEDMEFLGVLVFGPKTEVDELTKGFELFS